MEDPQVIIGECEWCSFDELNIPAILARVDSGAKTSSIQARNIKRKKIKGDLWVEFEVNPFEDNSSIAVDCKAKVIDIRNIKSSTGIVEKRYVIKTPLTIGNIQFDIELTLANREGMDFRMLLGREALKGRFIIDPNQNQVLKKISKTQLENFYGHLILKKSGLNIGLLATNRTLYSNKRIIEAGKARGHTMHFYNLQHCYMRLDTDTPEIRYRDGSVLNHLDAVIPRIRPSMTFYGCALLRQFHSIGTYCLNSAESITKSRDKLYSSQIFSLNKLNVPTTGMAKSPQDTKDLISMVGGAPLVVKVLESAQGKGVVLAETAKAAESVINAFKSLQANILVQEFIKEAEGKDLRCFVVDHKVVGSMQREATSGEFRANVHLGGTATKAKIKADERVLAIRAAKALNLSVAGVDIIRSNKGPLLLEVNSSPGLEGIENATGKDIASEMIASIERKLKFFHS
ncbi:MAG: 30S ribosomal protein S6--L-glutamate ligase [Flavobacteriaceae bacterium]|nr:30S ribosomal protein S6--L-glutamate ligase [Flavobacteriaceae bacterium]MCY4266689.1 30S ribosomal protein S6--L-glutamate ligase [Flavobacteriaceae bacterium]MCY4299724.1 30S ribosomal protein S6--L-glutamate ligase [Flavobacteriaceae bacterium]